MEGFCNSKFLNILYKFSLNEHLLIQEMDFRKCEGDSDNRFYDSICTICYNYLFSIYLHYLNLSSTDHFSFLDFIFFWTFVRNSNDPRIFGKTETSLASKLAYKLYVRMDGGMSSFESLCLHRIVCVLIADVTECELILVVFIFLRIIVVWAYCYTGCPQNRHR